MRCPDCGGSHVQTIIQNDRTQKPFGVFPACCGYLIFGAWGLLCGLCGARETQRTTVSRRCSDCGRVF